MFVCNTWIMKTWTFLLILHELWKYCLQYMNSKNMKVFFCNTWIMKTWTFLLILHELWKYLFAIHEFWKHESVCLQYMNYEKGKYHFAIHYEHFVCKTWIMKILNIFAIHELWKCLFAIHELWKYPFETHELWKN